MSLLYTQTGLSGNHMRSLTTSGTAFDEFHRLPRYGKLSLRIEPFDLVLIFPLVLLDI